MAGLDTSIFAFPTDLRDEGTGAVLDNVQHRAGLGGVTLATVYHEARDLFPHNPRGKVRFLEGGVAYFRPDPARYRGLSLEPRPALLVEGGDVLAELVDGRRTRVAWPCTRGPFSCTRTGSANRARSSPSGTPSETRS